jgi:hypothetical protein
MIRQFFFSEEYGRNTIWLMLSGFFLKIGAKENFYGQIVMPKNHYLFNLDKKNFNNDYLKFDNLHYIILDGPVEHLHDNRIKEIKKKILKFIMSEGLIIIGRILKTHNLCLQKAILNFKTY